MFPSKTSPTRRPAAFTIGLPELPPTMSFVRDEVGAGRQVETGLRVEPRLRQLERRRAGRPLVEPFQRA